MGKVGKLTKAVVDIYDPSRPEGQRTLKGVELHGNGAFYAAQNLKNSSFAASKAMSFELIEITDKKTGEALKNSKGDTRYKAEITWPRNREQIEAINANKDAYPNIKLKEVSFNLGPQKADPTKDLRISKSLFRTHSDGKESVTGMEDTKSGTIGMKRLLDTVNQKGEAMIEFDFIEKEGERPKPYIKNAQEISLTPEQEIKAMAEQAPDDINLEDELAKMEAEQGQTRQRELGI